MSQLFSFMARFRTGGDWTAAQRAKLEQLVERLTSAGVKVEAVFGRTDAGDPWCVVKGEDEEVLLHVARVGAKFVVHSVLDGAFEEAAELDTLLRARLDAEGEPKGDVVLPFELRRAQTLIALAVVAGGFDSLSPTPADAAPTPSPAPPDAPAPARPATEAAAVLQPHAELAATPAAPPASTPEAPPAPRTSSVTPAETPPIHHADAADPPASAAPRVVADPTPAEGAKPHATGLAPAPAAAAPHEIHGTAGNDRLEGSAAAERIVGGAGDDTLVGGGGADTLEGGDGNDVLVFSDGAFVSGGRGADTFVVHAPTHHAPDQLLGVILDFSAAEGDRIIIDRGKAKFPSRPRIGAEDAGGSLLRTSVSDDPPPASVRSRLGAHGDESPFTFTRIDVDVDDDGVSDGHLLVISRRHDSAHVEPAPVQVLGPDPAQPGDILLDVTGDGVADGHIATGDGGPSLLIVGRSLFSADPFNSN